MKKISVIVLMAVLAGCTTQTPRVTSPVGNSPIPVNIPAHSLYATPQTIHHVVGPSETLWRISKTYDVDIETIMKTNNLTDPTVIKNGQKLVIPNTYGPRPVIPLYNTRRWQYIVIHHTATDVGNAFSIDKLHHDRGFWNGLGYHFLIDNGTDSKAQGQIEVGPRWIKQLDGAHANADGMNQKGIGVSLVGNFSQEPVPSRMLDSVVYLVKTLRDYYQVPDENIIRHSDVPGKHTECPGLNFPWAEFKQRLRQG